MNRLIAFGASIATGVLAVQEPAPRKLAAVDIPLAGQWATVSGVHELSDGRLIASDARRAAVVIVDPRSGAAKPLGSIGGGANQYAQPGGFYAGLADTAYLLDRGQAKVLVISPAGEIVGSRSIRMQGRSSSSDDDLDHQRVDARPFAYFEDFTSLLHRRVGSRGVDSAVLLRLDPVHQRADTAVMLRRRQSQTRSVDEHLQVTQSVFGSPADGWGVAPDGRIAVVHASPYRVDWISPTGKISHGPVVAFDPVPYVQAEKDAMAAASSKSAPSAGIASADGAKSSTVNSTLLFADSKAPFENDSVVVAPNARVWVLRNQRYGAPSTVYDVFDERGERVDRVEIARGEHIVGFGRNAIYATGHDGSGRVVLHRYKL